VPSGFRADELELLRKAQGAQAVKMIAKEERTPKGTAIVMELAEGSLQSTVEELHRHLTEDEFLEDLIEILQGLVTLHEQGIIFGDLKPEN